MSGYNSHNRHWCKVALRATTLTACTMFGTLFYVIYYDQSEISFFGGVGIFREKRLFPSNSPPLLIIFSYFIGQVSSKDGSQSISTEYLSKSFPVD